MNRQKVLKLLFLISGLGMSPIYGAEIVVNTYEGDAFVLEIDPKESLESIQEKIAGLSGTPQSNFLIEWSGTNELRGLALKAQRQGAFLGYPRNYSAPVTPEEHAQIHFIVTTLANKSLISIALAKADLETAGKMIDHLHPLRFLGSIFTSEELKVGIRNIRGKGWVWSEFVGGLKESLSTEYKIGNMKADDIYHFAAHVKIHPAVISPAVADQKWDEFVDLLIKHIPRVGDHDRFDH